MTWTPSRIKFLLCGLSFFSSIHRTHADTPTGTEPSAISKSIAVSTEAPKASKSKVLMASDGVEVEMFQAMADGQLDVDYIAKDATQANLVFHNRTDKPLKIKLPETFGAVHVLAQGRGGGGMGGMGGGGMGGMGGGAMGGMGGGGGQGMGGGMGGGGMGGGGMGGGGMGGGMFRVDADKPRKMPVATVCLEHGKLDPTSRMKYKVVPLEVVNADPQISELCKLLGNGKVSQNAAQAAAWHVANGLTWQELMSKPRVISKYTGTEMFFSQFEVQNAIRLVAQVAQVKDDATESGSSYSTESVESARQNDPK